jgi:hypothetical protein
MMTASNRNYDIKVYYLMRLRNITAKCVNGQRMYVDRKP